MGVILRGKATALARLKRRGITVLDQVPVTPSYLSRYSYCIGCDDADSISIHVAGKRALLGAVGYPDDEGMEVVLVHEYGHAFLFKIWNFLTISEREKFETLFGKYHDDRWGLTYLQSVMDEWRETLGFSTRTYDKRTHASLYATVNAHEDWAETFEQLMFGSLPTRIGLVLKKKVLFIKKLVRKYGKQARVRLHRT
jgi:hypothetical protein